MALYLANITYIIYSYNDSNTIGPSFEDVCGNIYTLDSSYPSYTYSNSEPILNLSFNFPSSDPNSSANNNPLAGMNTVILGTNCSNISQYAFYDCSSLTTVTIQPSGLTSISNYAFYACSKLLNITIGNGGTSIGVSAFSGCSSLNSVTIPSSVISIGDTAFESCSSLTSIIIPSSVMTIGNNSFELCSNLQYVYTDSTTSTVYTSGTNSTNVYSSFFGGPSITVTISDISSSDSHSGSYKLSWSGIDKTTGKIVTGSYTGSVTASANTVYTDAHLSAAIYAFEDCLDHITVYVLPYYSNVNYTFNHITTS